MAEAATAVATAVAAATAATAEAGPPTGVGGRHGSEDVELAAELAVQPEVLLAEEDEEDEEDDTLTPTPQPAPRRLPPEVATIATPVVTVTLGMPALPVASVPDGAPLPPSAVGLRCVQWNPNPTHHEWIACGASSGLLLLMRLPLDEGDAEDDESEVLEAESEEEEAAPTERGTDAGQLEQGPARARAASNTHDASGLLKRPPGRPPKGKRWDPKVGWVDANE